MSLAELWVELQSAFRGLTSLGFGVTGQHIVIWDLTKEARGAAKTSVCQSIVGIFLDGFLIAIDALVKVAAIGPVKAAAQIFVVGFRIYGPCGSFRAIDAWCANGKGQPNLAGA